MNELKVTRTTDKKRLEMTTPILSIAHKMNMRTYFDRKKWVILIEIPRFETL